MPLAGLSRVGEENSRFSSKRAGFENGGQASLGERGPQQAPREPPGGSAARAASHTCLPRGLPAFPRGAPRAQGHLRRPAQVWRAFPPGRSAWRFRPALQLRPSFEVAPPPRGNAPAAALAPIPGCPTGLGAAEAWRVRLSITLCGEWPQDHATPPGPPWAPLGPPRRQWTAAHGSEWPVS